MFIVSRSWQNVNDFKQLFMPNVVKNTPAVVGWGEMNFANSP